MIIMVTITILMILKNNDNIHDEINHNLVATQYFKAYFRRRAATRRTENISARLGSVWHASILDEENIVVLKQLYC